MRGPARIVAAPKRLARLAGLLYLTLAVLGGLAELYVRGGVRVSGDAAATADNVLANATLFRLGFAGDLVAITAYLMVAMALYLLLKHVNQNVATAMVIFVALAVAIMSVNMLNHFGALMVATDGSYAATFGEAGSDALVLTFLELHGTGYLVAQIFFGLWLLPLGYLAYRSGYFPRALGVLLIVGCFAYLIEALAFYVGLEPATAITAVIVAPAAVAEFWMVGYLLVKGVREPRPDQAAPVAAAVAP